MKLDRCRCRVLGWFPLVALIVAPCAAAGDAPASVAGRCETELMIAAHHADAELARALLDRGLDPDEQDEYGQTALHCLPFLDDPRVVEILAARGTDLDHEDAIGLTALAKAAGRGQTALVRTLVELGAGVDAGREDETPLARALLRGHVDAAAMLLEAGARPNPPSGGGLSLAHRLAAADADHELAMIGSAGVDLEARSARPERFAGETPLMYAARADAARSIAVLLDHGARAATRNRFGMTALQIASFHGSAAAARVLLSRGAPPDDPAGERSRSAPIVLAALGGHDEAVQVLIDGGADMDSANRSGVTALIAASYRGDAPLVGLLLDRGAGVERRDHRGCTALIIAALRAHEEVVARLVEHGAELEPTCPIAEFGSVTALMLAAGRGHETITRSLLAGGADPDRSALVEPYGELAPVLLAALRGHAGVVEALLEAGADASVTDDDGHGAAELARRSGHAELAAVLAAAPSAP